MIRRSLAALALVAITCASRSAGAEPTLAEKASARTMLDDGYAVLERDPKQALKLFLAADATMKVPTTALAVGRAQAASGLLVEARDTLVAVTREPEKAGEPAPFRRAREDAATLLRDVEARLPTLRIDVQRDGNEPFTVRLDGQALALDALGKPRRVNPGHHVVVVTRGASAISGEIDVAEHDDRPLVIRLEGTAAKPEAPPAPSAGRSPLVYIGFGTAAAFTITGSVTGILAITAKGGSAIANGCVQNACGPGAHDAVDNAKLLATVSTVSFIVAGAGAALGVVGLFVSDGHAATAATIEPYLSATGGGLRGSF